MSVKTVLIVDDDAEVHELLQAMLRNSPWVTEGAFGGAEALTRLAAKRYDLVLTDILMPDLSGLELLTKIHAGQPEVKVVIMTADNQPHHVLGSLRGQAAGYLAKPFSRDKLLDALNDALAWNVGHDDIEVLSDRPHWISVKVRCKMETADRLVQFFRELPTGLDADAREQAATAFRELLINAVEHGGRLDPEKKVELHYVRTERSIVYYFRDPGEGFSMDNLAHAAISHPDSPLDHAEIREQMGIRPGGFGLLLLKNFADELLYTSKGNEVIFIKRLDPAS